MTTIITEISRHKNKTHAEDGEKYDILYAIKEIAN